MFGQGDKERERAREDDDQYICNAGEWNEVYALRYTERVRTIKTMYTILIVRNVDARILFYRRCWILNHSVWLIWILSLRRSWWW